MAALAHALLTVGKPKAGYIREGLADYAKRLKPYGGCQLIHVKQARAGKGSSAQSIKRQEAANLLGRIKERDALWALEPKGNNWSSREWARRLQKARLESPRRLVLLVGGAEGLDQEILTRADHQVSLGPATLPHELAALVALEQLYRAHTILAGIPYHRA